MYAVEEVFYKKGILTSFAKVTGKHLYRNLFFFDKVTGWRPTSLAGDPQLF